VQKQERSVEVKNKTKTVSPQTATTIHTYHLPHLCKQTDSRLLMKKTRS